MGDKELEQRPPGGLVLAAISDREERIRKANVGLQSDNPRILHMAVRFLSFLAWTRVIIYKCREQAVDLSTIRCQ